MLRVVLCVVLLWFAGTQVPLAQTSAPPRIATKAVAMTATLEADRSSAYQNEQILLTLTLRTRREAFGVSGGEPEIDGATITSLHKREFAEQIAGISYQTTERLYSAFAEQPGQLTVSPIRFQAQLPVSFSKDNNNSNPQISASTEALELEIINPPVSQAVWLPASGLTVSHQWIDSANSSLARAVSGEPIDYTVRIEILGQHPAAIAPLQIAATDGLRVYPQQSNWELVNSPTSIAGTFEQTITLIVSTAQSLEFPGVTVNWWDINRGQWQATSTPAETLVIQAANGQAANGQAANGQAANWHQAATDFSRLVPGVLLCSLALAMAAIYCYTANSGKRATQSERAAWARVKRGLVKHDPALLRSALSVWSIHLINSAEPELARIITALDQVLYGSGSADEPDWADIKSRLLIVRARSIKPKTSKDALEVLYLAD